MNIDDFKEAIRAKDPHHVNRHVDACDWYYNDIELFHERSYWPHSPFKPSMFSYWPSTVYTDRQLAEAEAKQFGGEVTECFYAEPGTLWFVAFHELDRAIAYVFNQLQQHSKI